MRVGFPVLSVIDTTSVQAKKFKTFCYIIFYGTAWKWYNGIDWLFDMFKTALILNVKVFNLLLQTIIYFPCDYIGWLI